MHDFYAEALVTYRRRYNELFKETGDTVISRVEDGYAKHILQGRVLERLGGKCCSCFIAKTFEYVPGAYPKLSELKACALGACYNFKELKNE